MNYGEWPSHRRDQVVENSVPDTQPVQPDGRAFAGDQDMTCRNWTSSGEGAAMLGHHDRLGLRDDDGSKSCTSSHPLRATGGGCSQEALRGTGGNGLLYCFAAN